MEFSPRGFQRNTGRPASPAPNLDGSAPSGDTSRAPHRQAAEKLKGSKLGLVLAVVAVVVVLALAWTLLMNKSESSLVDGKRYQAVFLSNGQVYFGKIKDINRSYINLEDIYYLNVGDQNVQPSESSQQNVSLVKLGCELHSPQDQMVIYRDQVTFWENLKDEGQVATAIQDWKEQNPDGQKCSQQTTQQTQQPATNNNESDSDNTNENTTDNSGASGTQPSGTGDQTNDTPTTNQDSDTTPTTPTP